MSVYHHFIFYKKDNRTQTLQNKLHMTLLLRRLELLTWPLEPPHTYCIRWYNNYIRNNTGTIYLLYRERKWWGINREGGGPPIRTWSRCTREEVIENTRGRGSHHFWQSHNFCKEHSWSNSRRGDANMQRTYVVLRNQKCQREHTWMGGNRKVATEHVVGQKQESRN